MTSEAEPPTTESPRRRAPIVLVADATPERRQAAADVMRASGYLVLQADSPERALACCRIVEPDVVILDADPVNGLFERDGGSVLAILGGADELRHVPVVTISSDPSAELVADCLAAGASDHLRGPVLPVELVARTAAVLRVADEQERLRRRNQQLEFLGSTDMLTGLANRRHIEDELRRLASAAARYHHPLAVVLLGVDHWADLERRGPDTADAVLEEVGVLIGAIARTGDLAGRFSRDSFIVLLPMTAVPGARVFAERVRNVVAAAPILTSDGRVQVSLSAGCADGAPGPEELLGRAEEALARALADGGDRLVSISA